MWLEASQDISILVNKAYNFYGDFNLKILTFGFIGQIFTIFFKNNFPNNTFSLIFSVFFITASLSSIPNADRFIYYCLLLSFPYLIGFSVGYVKNIISDKKS